MPCYNGEKYLNRSIGSIYSQNYSNIELIIVNDGSTDKSEKIIISWKQRFKEKNYELKYIYQNNKGPGGAINTGLKHVTGDYISLLDVDDEYLPNCISERALYLSSHPEVSIVRSNGYIVSNKQKQLFTDDNNEKSIKDVFTALLTWKTYNWAGSYMLRSKELFDFYPDRNIYESRDGQNLQLMLPLLYKKPCGFIDKPHMNYNRQPDSLSQSSDFEEQKQKIISATQGYTDIRLYMIELIVKDSIEEKNYLAQQIVFAQYRYLLNIAIMYNDRDLLNDCMNCLKEDSEHRLDNLIVYYSVQNPPLSFFLRAIRKIKSCLRSDNNAKLT